MCEEIVFNMFKFMQGVPITVCAIITMFNGAESLAADIAAAKEYKSVYVRPSTIPFPEDNPYTPQKAALGKALFFDPRLSGHGNMTCATCHNPSFGWETPQTTPIGAKNTALERQAPTILNVAFIQPFFWDGRAKTAEEQAKGPIENPLEMDLPLQKAVAVISASPDYTRLFDAVFPGKGVTEDTIVQAIATYERTVVASYSPFDAWIDGDEKAISDSAKRGFVVFNEKGECAVCHSGWNFTDNLFHDIGVTDTDLGRGKLDPNNQLAQFAFKTPSLRDIAQRAPYMHNGLTATLKDVVRHYETGGIDRPSRSPLMNAIQLSDQERDDLVAFLHSLTGTKQVVPLPILPN